MTGGINNEHSVSYFSFSIYLNKINVSPISINVESIFRSFMLLYTFNVDFQSTLTSYEKLKLMDETLIMFK